MGFFPQQDASPTPSRHSLQKLLAEAFCDIISVTSLSPLSLDIFHVIHDPLKITMGITDHKDWFTCGVPSFDWKTHPCYWNYNRVDFNALVDQKLRDLLSEYEADNPIMCQNHRSHYGEFSSQFLFPPGTLLLGPVDVALMELNAKFLVGYHKTKLLSKFELKGQGRAYSYERIDSNKPAGGWEINIVQRI